MNIGKRTASGVALCVALCLALVLSGSVASMSLMSGSSGSSATAQLAHVMTTAEVLAGISTGPPPDLVAETSDVAPPGVELSIDRRALAANNVTLVPTDDLPLITEEQAIQAIADMGVPWAIDGTWEGVPVTVQAAYGRATFGQRNPDGILEGERNIPLPSGEVLDHIEQRLMWLIDVGNVVFYAGGCPECPPPPEYNHAVYAVDAETGRVWFVWPYVGDSTTH